MRLVRGAAAAIVAASAVILAACGTSAPNVPTVPTGATTAQTTTVPTVPTTAASSPCASTSITPKFITPKDGDKIDDGNAKTAIKIAVPCEDYNVVYFVFDKTDKFYRDTDALYVTDGEINTYNEKIGGEHAVTTVQLLIVAADQTCTKAIQNIVSILPLPETCKVVDKIGVVSTRK
jgi:hypothetical protein